MPQEVEIVHHPDGSWTLELVEKVTENPPPTATIGPRDPAKHPVYASTPAGTDGQPVYAPATTGTDDWPKDEFGEYQAYFRAVDPAEHVELQPAHGNFLVTVLTDYYQRLNFAMAGAWKAEFEKRDEVYADVETRKQLILEENPNLDPKIAEGQAWTDVDGRKQLGLNLAKNLAINPLVMGVIDLILKKDTPGAYRVWNGLTGTDQSTFIDLAFEREWGTWKGGDEPPTSVGEAFMQLNLLPVAIGLIMDMGLDPATYIPFALATKYVGKGGKALTKTAVVQKMTERLNNTSPINFLGHAFKKGYKLPKDWYEFLTQTRRMGRWKQQQFYEQGIDLYKRIQGDEGKIAKLMTYVRQHPDNIQKLSPVNQKLLREIGDLFVSTGQKAVDAGIIPLKSFETLKDTYIWGSYANYTKTLNGAIPASVWQRLNTPSFAQHKVFRTIADSQDYAKSMSVFYDANSLPEIKRMARAFRTNPNEPSIFEKAFEYTENLKEAKAYVKAAQASHVPGDDIIQLVTGYQMQVDRVIEARKFVDDTMLRWGTEVNAKDFAGTTLAKDLDKAVFLPTGRLRFYPGGKEAQNIVDQLVRLAGGEGSLIELTPEVKKLVAQLENISLEHVGVTSKVKAYLIDPEIARTLNKTNSLFYGDPASNRFMKWLDKWYGAWKMMATSARLPFHSRNIYSSAMMNYFDGMELYEVIPYYYKATAMVLKKGGDLVVKETGKVIPAATVLEMAGKHGILGTGWIGADTTSMWKMLDQMQKTGRVKKALYPWEWGKQLGTVTENQARMAKFIERLEKGDDFDVAAKRVFKTHYDYAATGFTDFELKLKKAFPFYGWTRNNLPRMTEVMITEPGRVGVVGKITDAIYSLNPETTEEMLYKPVYMDTQIWTKVPDFVVNTFGKGTSDNIYMRFDTPLADLTGIGEAVFGNAKPLTQQVYSLLNPYALKGFVEALSIYAGGEEGRGIKFFPELGPLQRFPGEKVPAPWFIVLLPEWLQQRAGIGVYTDQRTGKDVMGMPKWAYGLMMSSLPAAKQLENLHTNPVDVERGYSAWRKLSWLTGVSFTPINKAEQKFWAARDAQGQLSAFRPFFFQEGRAPTTKEKRKILMDLGYTDAQADAALKGLE